MRAVTPREPDSLRPGAGRRCLVVGLGRSGFAAARLLHQSGALVRVSDASPEETIPLEVRNWLREYDIVGEFGGHSERFFGEAELIVVSPGVPLSIGPLRQALRAGIPLTGELGLAASLLEIPVVAVTGTNGKSTVTELIGGICRAAGRAVFVGGNLGTPLSEYLLVPGESAELAVLEVSSYQLATAPAFRPKVGVLLNITPDHLEYHGGYEGYLEAKLGIFENQGGSDYAVINGNDRQIIEKFDDQWENQLYFFGSDCEGAYGAEIIDRTIRLRFAGGGDEQEEYLMDNPVLAEEPNLHNAAAAILAARLAGCGPEAVRRGLTEFSALDHRLTRVAAIGGVDFIDDSKATNVGAVMAALAGQDRPVVWLAGGRDKGGSYEGLRSLVGEKVRAVVLIGEARERMAAVFSGLARVEQALGMAEAVALAFKLARPGDVVLLSPACASFDMFRNYQHRGEVYRREVLDLRDGAGSRPVSP